jgi:ribosomal protein S18 acetylase RimI-like enzyme
MTLRFLSFKDLNASVFVIKSTYIGLSDVSDLFEKEFIRSFETELSSLKFVGYEVDGQLVGVSAFDASPMSERSWELCWATVLPEYQGQGIGKSMLDLRVSTIKQQATLKPGVILVHTRPTKLYLDAGFEKIKKVVNEKYILAKDI